MFKLSEKNKNGLLIIKTSLIALWKFKIVGLVALTSVAFNLFIFSVFIDVEYQYYGVHILDYTTFKKLIGLNFWHHIGHFLVLFFILMLITIVTWYTQFILCYIAIQEYKKKPLSFKRTLLIPFKNVKELFRIAFIYSIQSIKRFLNLFSFPNHLNNTTHIATGKLEEVFDEYNKPEQLLFIPLITEQSLTFMDALTESENMLSNKFKTENLSINFSFLFFRHLAGALIFLILGGIFHFLLDIHIFNTIILCSIAIIALESFITNVTLLFNCAVYNYCKVLPTGPFSADTIQKIFTTK